MYLCSSSNSVSNFLSFKNLHICIHNDTCETLFLRMKNYKQFNVNRRLVKKNGPILGHNLLGKKWTQNFGTISVLDVRLLEREMKPFGNQVTTSINRNACSSLAESGTDCDYGHITWQKLDFSLCSTSSVLMTGEL